MARLRLLLRPWERTAAAILNVVPLPGVGALLAGWRNAHTTLRRNGALQMALVILGSWPLVLPGAIGLAWAAWDTVRIARADLRRPPSPETPPPEGARPRQAAPPKAARR